MNLLIKYYFHSILGSILELITTIEKLVPQKKKKNDVLQNYILIMIIQFFTLYKFVLSLCIYISVKLVLLIQT